MRIQIGNVGSMVLFRTADDFAALTLEEARALAFAFNAEGKTTMTVKHLEICGTTEVYARLFRLLIEAVNGAEAFRRETLHAHRALNLVKTQMKLEVAA